MAGIIQPDLLSPHCRTMLKFIALPESYMQRPWFRRIAANVLMAGILVAIVPSAPRAQSAEDIAALNRRAVQLYEQGNYVAAMALTQKALTLAERVLGPDHPNTLATLNNLATVYSEQGRYADAEPIYKRVLETRERVLGPEHPDTLISLNNLATLYSDQGRYAEAASLYRRALQIRERVLGKDHPDTLFSVNNLAAVYQDQGRYAKQSHFTNARSRPESDARPGASPNADKREQSGGPVRRPGPLCEAEPLHRRTLEVRERVLGKEHPDTLASLNNLALLYKAQGRYDGGGSRFTARAGGAGSAC